MSCITATFVPPVRCPLASRLALALVLTALAPIARAEPLHAWVELVGRGGAPSVRVITADATCPPLRADGEEVAMQVRAGPQPLFQGDSKGSKPPTARFPVTVCEATLKRGTARAVLDGNQPLPLPPAVINRIVVLGDTGCRLSKKERQDCDPKGWPYADLARRAADAAPDLVIHVGDYLYREVVHGSGLPDNRLRVGRLASGFLYAVEAALRRRTLDHGAGQSRDLRPRGRGMVPFPRRSPAGREVS